MCSIDMWFSDSSSSDCDDNTRVQLLRRRRVIRDKANPLEMNSKEFIENFRLSKNAFLDVLTEIGDKLQTGIRSTSVPNVLKLALTLKFLAKGSYQLRFDKDFSFGLAQPTVSVILRDVLNVLEKNICPQYIDFHYSESEVEEVKSYFKEKSGIPGVIGCIGSFHVKIIAPEKKIQYLYYNSKGYHSINAMIVCDHKMVIRFINAKHPGSSDDSMVFDVSTLKTYLEKRYQDGHRESWLLGDTSYDLQPYLMTPYRNPKINSPQSYYNQCHDEARNTMKNTINVLKTRFLCLSGKKSLHYTPKKASQIINVCAALHNICCAFNLMPPKKEQNSFEESDCDDDCDDDSELDFIEENSDAEAIRSEIVKHLSYED